MTKPTRKQRAHLKRITAAFQEARAEVNHVAGSVSLEGLALRKEDIERLIYRKVLEKLRKKS